MLYLYPDISNQTSSGKFDGYIFSIYLHFDKLVSEVLDGVFYQAVKILEVTTFWPYLRNQV